MGEIKLNRDSEEFIMFQDYWKLFQSNLLVEDTDDYWQKVVDESTAFRNKYRASEFAEELALAYLNEMDRRGKARNPAC